MTLRQLTCDYFVRPRFSKLNWNLKSNWWLLTTCLNKNWNLRCKYVQIGFIKFLQLLLLSFMSQKHRLQTRAVEYLFLIMLIFYVSNWWGGAAELIVLTVKYYYYYHHGIECLRKLIGSSLINKVALYGTPETWLCSAWLRVQKDYVKISHMF